MVVLQHGVSGDFCNLFWLARYLAGHGYVSFTYTATPPGGETSLDRSLRAVRSTIAFARTDRNPFAARTNDTRIGVGGFSLGAVTASVIQSEPGIDAAIVLDNLRRWELGDPGGVGANCTGRRARQITPRAPALGFAQDAPCKERPGFAPRSLKQYGFRHWRSKDIASMELVLRNFKHTDYGSDGTASERRLVGYYADAWFDRWLGSRRGAEDRLLAARVLGERRRALLSRRFASGAYLPGRINTVDLRSQR